MEKGTEGAAKKPVGHLKDKGEVEVIKTVDSDEDDEDALESEIKDALYEEKKLDKK